MAVVLSIKKKFTESITRKIIKYHEPIIAKEITMKLKAGDNGRKV